MFKKINDKIALGSANLISTIINSLFWIFLASILTKESYGELGFLFAVAYSGWAFANVGIDKLIIVYGSKNEDIYQPAYAFTIISAAIVSSISYVITQNIETSVLIWGFMIFMVHISKLNSNKQFVEQAKHTILYRILTIIFSLLLYLVMDINGIILGGALASIPASKWIYDLLKTKKIKIQALRPKLKFMIHNYFSILTLTLFVSGDKLLIGLLFGFSVLGSFTFALQYVYALNAIPVTLMMYLLPHEAQNIENKKLKIYSIILSVILAILLIILAPYIIEGFFPKYQEAIVPMQITSVGIIPWVISIIFEARFIGKEKSKVVLIATSTQTGIYFLLLILLGFEYGIIGFSIAFLISIIIRCIIDTAAYLKHS